MNILAFCPTHDSSVCFLKNGKVEFYCKEERLSREKHDNDPLKSLQLFFSLFKENIDSIVNASPTTNSTVRGFFHRFINKHIKYRLPFQDYSHHLCHAMLAFVNSKFEESLVIVIDRDGSLVHIENELIARESESVYCFHKSHGFRELHKAFWKFPNGFSQEDAMRHVKKLYRDAHIKINSEFSIVKVYEAATTLIGQNPLENGKTMGLSSYGDENNFIDDPLFYEDIPFSHKFTHLYKHDNTVVGFFGEEHLITNNLLQTNYNYYANRAKQVQLETQKQVLNLIKKYTQKTNIKNVCIVGGYGLNIVANNYYIKNLPEINFYFEPTADDTGVSIGGAMVDYFLKTNNMAEPLEDNFYHYYDNSEKIDIGFDSSIEDVVNLLLQGKSVAIFEGNPEAGPRALGHRSILFDARNSNAKEIVNRIKKREWYRPFAGVILEEEFTNYFDTLNVRQSPYMTINFDAKENAKTLVPGIIHIDGTCRIQTINNGFLYDLLKLFYDKTGCPMILNTSFNLAGEPLVQTKQQALETLRNSKLDAVFFVDQRKLVLNEDIK